MVFSTIGSKKRRWQVLRVGITGNIGAGKSFVCRELAAFEQIPVFYMDIEAKRLMHNHLVMEKVIEIAGPEVYLPTGEVNKERMRHILFSDEGIRKAIEAVVIPRLRENLDSWTSVKNIMHITSPKGKKPPYVLVEAATFYETGTDDQVDIMIGVNAPWPIRLERVHRRSGLNTETTTAIDACQMSSMEKMDRCDFVIENDGETDLFGQINRIHKTLLKTSKHGRGRR